MPNAIGYIRTSTKGQSYFSLDSQKDRITNYCREKGYELIEVFSDDGISASSFKRPGFIKMELFIKVHYKKIDFLIVDAIDRFSRQAEEGIEKLNYYQRKYSIKLVSVANNSDEKRNENLINAMQFLLAADEHRLISERTIKGMESARRKGYYINLAPLGYINDKENDGKPSIKIDEKKKSLIKTIFSLFLDGYSNEDIRKEIQKTKKEAISKTRISRILTNPVYAGLIGLPSKNGLETEYINGRHSPIIDQKTWLAVQEKLKLPRLRTVMDDNLPLRGVLHCHCGKRMTGSPCKGKSGKFYYYYNCTIKGHNYISAIISVLI